MQVVGAQDFKQLWSTLLIYSAALRDWCNLTWWCCCCCTGKLRLFDFNYSAVWRKVALDAPTAWETRLGDVQGWARPTLVLANLEFTGWSWGFCFSCRTDVGGWKLYNYFDNEQGSDVNVPKIIWARELPSQASILDCKALASCSRPCSVKTWPWLGILESPCEEEPLGEPRIEVFKKWIGAGEEEPRS